MIHELKTVNPYFTKVFLGAKMFELRKNDRDFKELDTLVLKEYDAEKNEYSGNCIEAKVIYILEDFPGIENGYCIMGIRVTGVFMNCKKVVL